jgi:hypothetical protein
MNHPKLVRFINRHPDAIAAAVGLLCVIVGIVLSIELHPYYR